MSDKLVGKCWYWVRQKEYFDKMCKLFLFCSVSAVTCELGQTRRWMPVESVVAMAAPASNLSITGTPRKCLYAQLHVGEVSRRLPYRQMQFYSAEGIKIKFSSAFIPPIIELLFTLYLFLDMIKSIIKQISCTAIFRCKILFVRPKKYPT